MLVKVNAFYKLYILNEKEVKTTPYIHQQKDEIWLNQTLQTLIVLKPF